MRGCCGPLTPLRALVTAILLGLLSIALPFVLQPLALDSAPSSGSGNVLGEGGYDIIPIDAPAASGTTLRLLAWLFARRSLSPLLARGLLNQNGVWKLRELAEQVPETVVQRHLPLHRLGAAEHAEHAALARGSSTRLALSPLRKIRESVDGPSATLAVSDVGHSSIEGMANSYEAGETTPTAVAQQVLKSIVTAQQLYGAIFVEVQPHTVMAQAEESTQRWEHGNPRSVFDGVPVAIKDMVEVRHHTMTDGSATADGSTPATQDDPIVAKLRAAGAIIVGTTVMTEFGVTPLGWSAHRQGPRNPRNKSHYPGGSSSGSAVAVALGIVPVAVGFDGGGSIRIPAALSGVYGLAAGFGRVHFKGKFGASSSMVHAGPLTNSARDLALTYLLLAQPLSYHCSDCAPSIETPHTTHSLYGGDAPAPHISLNPTVWSSGEDPDLSGVRLGVYRAHFDDATPPVRQALGQLEQELVDRGATIVDFSIPHMQALSVAHGMSISVEFSSEHDRQYCMGQSLLEPSTVVQLALGNAMTGVEYMAATRLKSWAFEYVRDEIFGKLELDAILSPTTSMTAPELSVAAMATGESNTALVLQLTKHIFLGNLLGLPALSVPVGVDPNSMLPIGAQLVGSWWSEARLLELAAAIENMRLARQ